MIYWEARKHTKNGRKIREYESTKNILYPCIKLLKDKFNEGMFLKIGYCDPAAQRRLSAQVRPVLQHRGSLLKPSVRFLVSVSTLGPCPATACHTEVEQKGSQPPRSQERPDNTDRNTPAPQKITSGPSGRRPLVSVSGLGPSFATEHHMQVSQEGS